MSPRLRNQLMTSTALLALGAALMTLGAAPGGAQPTGGTVVGGTATISGAGTNSVIVNQSSNRAIINWNTFNVSTGGAATFNQPDSSAITLNRVTGGLGPSVIDGTITANGRVFIINRDGMLFGRNAVVNTAGFLATTNDIRNDDFMAGRMNFNIAGRADASIVNLGTITASSHGFAALVAPGVRNTGTITATLGTVALASGNSFTLDMYGDKLIQLAVGDQVAGKVIDVATGKPLSSLVGNDGTLSANGGRVELTAAAARQVVDSVINNRGVIEANSIGTRNGMIVLGGATASSKNAGQPKQTIKVAGKISATGKDKGAKGGTIEITGEDIQFAAAMLDVSGHSGGGKILVGGDYGGGRPIPGAVNNQSAVLEGNAIPTATTVTVDSATTFNASATANGHGGKVILWSDMATTFAGTIFARGGEFGGNGGFVEVSGKQQLAYGGSVDTRAPNGLTGTLLLDPTDFAIDNTAGPNAITPTDLQNQLALSNVVIETQATGQEPGDIWVRASVTWSGDNSLTLRAHRNIQFDDAVISNIGAGNLVLRADREGTGNGTVIFSGLSAVDFTNSTGKVSIFYNPSEGGYANPTDFTSAGQGENRGVFVNQPNQLAVYMLVNTFRDLQNVGTNLNGTYALGRDVNADNMGPIGASWAPFTGTFEGNGHTISNAIITGSGQQTHIGLFAGIGAGGIVRNLTLSGFQVTANTSPDLEVPEQFIGTLAGSNAGTISNVTVINSTVSGLNMAGVTAGGLVGRNGMLAEPPVAATITNSSSSAVVTVGNGCWGDCYGGTNLAGGLVGLNLAGATITASSATGNVSGGAYASIGGLVGQNEGSITGSFASGNVTSTAIGNVFSGGVGGLVGANSGLISGSHATGNASGVGSSEYFLEAIVGGIVGFNEAAGQITNSYATGAVSGTNSVQLGGLVGGNDGAITNSYATGDVTGSGRGSVGGLVGINSFGGTITNSYATGAVGGAGSLNAGGLVGDNWAAISNSYATGNVSVTSTGADYVVVGGLVASNSGNITGSHATGSVTTLDGVVTGGGFAGVNFGSTANSYASGNVTANGASLAMLGGFTGGNVGTVTNSHAIGNVNTNAAFAIVGGFVGLNVGKIDLSFATGSVAAGNGSFVGGFVGFNFGEINQAYANGVVTGGDNSFVGGFVGANLNVNVSGEFGDGETPPSAGSFGSITQSYALGPVTGGNAAVAASFAALNFGKLDQVYGVGRVLGGTGSTLGGLVAVSNPTVTLPDFGLGTFGGGNLPTGTATNAFWDMQTTALVTSAGGVGMNTAVLSGGLPPGFDPQVWNHHSYPFLVNIVPNNQDTTPLPPVIPPIGGDPNPNPPLIPPPDQQINVTPLTPTLPSDPVPNVVQFVQQQQQQQQRGQQAADQTVTGSVNDPIRLDAGENRFFYIPPPGETRLVTDEVVLQMPCDVPADTLNAILKQRNLSVLDSQCLQQGAQGAQATYRMQHTSSETVADVIRALVEHQIIAAAQANYLYALTEAKVQSATSQQGDPGQYVPEKFRLTAVHRVVRGNGVSIAVIDSEIDGTHPDLSGAIATRYDATGVDDNPHPHGTGMAGAIVSHQRLLGVAPGARIMAIRAFSTRANAESTTYNILRGLDWAVDNNVRIINMSFAGPRDPSLERALKTAYDKGVILVAAAGNAGPRAPALFPAADPNVIAVTATDVEDRLFAGANRGNHVAIAAPGVDVLVPAPAGEYQVTTGTSVATAHISGVIALMLERNPKLTPAEVRRILAGSAKRLGPVNMFGAGLVDPVRAVEMSTPRSAAMPAWLATATAAAPAPRAAAVAARP